MTLFYVCISKLNSRVYKTRMVRVFNDESYIIVISRYLSKEVFSPTKTHLTNDLTRLIRKTNKQEAYGPYHSPEHQSLHEFI